MLIVISPAKTLNFDREAAIENYSMPHFLDDSETLVESLKKQSPDELSELMNMSPKLADLNYDRFQKWSRPFTDENAKQAILAFTGEVYEGLNVRGYSEENFLFAQDHIRILSGLYGLLKPLDLIQPYRLEMGTKLSSSKGKNLYSFWGDKISRAINVSFNQDKIPLLVNLASQEYFKSIDLKKLNAPVITPVFKEFKVDKYKVVSFSAKRARGLMSSYIIKNRLNRADEIKSFDEEGYSFNKGLSSEKEWIFTRKS